MYTLCRTLTPFNRGTLGASHRDDLDPFLWTPGAVFGAPAHAPLNAASI